MEKELDKMATVLAMVLDVYRKTIERLQMTVIVLLVLYLVTLVGFCIALKSVDNHTAQIGVALPMSTVAARALQAKAEKRGVYA